jgi:hypothetical protein
MGERDEAYEVGYSKPPKQTRFAKGKSGNPKGRPRGSKNLSTLFDQACREKVTVNRHGRTVRMTKLQACTHQLANKAANGDLKAIHSLLSWSQTLKEGEESQTGSLLDENDQATMASILRRLKDTASIETIASNAQNSDQEKE